MLGDHAYLQPADSQTPQRALTEPLRAALLSPCAAARREPKVHLTGKLTVCPTASELMNSVRTSDWMLPCVEGEYWNTSTAKPASCASLMHMHTELCYNTRQSPNVLKALCYASRTSSTP